MIVPSSVAMSVKRVVTCFILSSSSPPSSSSSSSSKLTRDTLRVAVFQRKSTMPTFPSHWAGISGSMEDGEEPYQTAQRELQEETNLIPSTKPGNDPSSSSSNGPTCHLDPMGGLYLDVPFREDRKIRVYPFVVRLDNNNNNKHPEDSSNPQLLLELKGTEHDTYQFISIPELEQLQPAVPGLAEAFHHATFGQFLAPDALHQEIWTWASDKVNGASTLARQAIPLAQKYPESIGYMKMLRPTMVAIVNVLEAMQQELGQSSSSGDQAAQSIQQSLQQEVDRSTELGVQALHEKFMYYQSTCATTDLPQEAISSQPFTIATFSRSSTLVKILKQFLTEQTNDNKANNHPHHNIPFQILCGKSTPGDEGVLMAQDLEEALLANNNNNIQIDCLEDDELRDAIREARVHAVIVGADCVLVDGTVVNKIGTQALAETCQSTETPILCCTDRFKIWEDIFPPPLEDIFECVSKEFLDPILIPGKSEHDMVLDESEEDKQG